jgi:hypothetical protein
MNKKVNNNKIFICKICDKKYSSASSLCNHNNKFHSEVSQSKVSQNTDCDQSKVSQLKIYTCSYCGNNYKHKQSRWSHEQKCKNKDDLDELKNIINELKQQFALILKQNKTLQKMNNQVSNTINGNVNNGTIINNTYVKFGDISYEKIFDEKQILAILNKQYMSLEEGISKTHFNEKLPEYSNIFITNLKDPLSYIFNGKAFITVKKHNMLNELIDTHINEINLSYDKMKNKIIPKHADRIENFLQKLNDIDTKYKDPENDRVYSNYKAYKMDAIKLAIYNGSDKKKLESLKNIKLIEKIDSDSDDSDIEI